MRLCYNCTFICVREYVPDWSDKTPGNPFEMYCSKQHWEFDPSEATPLSIKECLETAEQCVDFSLEQHVNLSDEPTKQIPSYEPTCHKCSTPLTKVVDDKGSYWTICITCSGAEIVWS